MLALLSCSDQITDESACVSSQVLEALTIIHRTILLDVSYKKLLYLAKKTKNIDLMKFIGWISVLRYGYSKLLATNLFNLRKRIVSVHGTDNISVMSFYVEQKKKIYSIRKAARGSRFRAFRTTCRLVVKLCVCK